MIADKEKEHRIAVWRGLKKIDEETKRSERQNLSIINGFGTLFVANPAVQSLYSNDWQIFFGRRGTGKTTILRALQFNIEENNGVCVSVNMDDCLPSFPGKNYTVEEIATDTFGIFVKKISNSLLDIYTEKNANKNLFDKYIGSNAKTRKEADNIIEEIAHIAVNGRPRLRFRDINAETRDEIFTKYGVEIEAKLQLDLGSIDANASTTAKGSQEKSKNAVVVSQYALKAITRYTYIRRLLTKLLDLLKIDRIFILIDEWVSLNRDDKTVQSLFAEYLHRVMFPEIRISVKIASIRSQTFLKSDLDENRSVGIDIGHDIFSSIDLDKLYSNQIDQRNFFEELLFRRICFYNPDNEVLEKFKSSDDSFVPEEQFWSAIFEKNSSIEDFIEASRNVPREFLELIALCTRLDSRSLKKPWPRGRIRTQLGTRSLDFKRELDGRIDPIAKLFASIKNHCKSIGSRHFLVPRKKPEEVENLFEELFHRHYIHLSNKNIPLYILSDSDCYSLDFGLFIATRKDKDIFSDNLPTGETEESIFQSMVFPDWPIDKESNTNS